MSYTDPYRPAGFYLRHTWPARLTKLVLAALSLALAAVALGLAVASVIQVVFFITAGTVSWVLAAYLVAVIVTAVLTITWARVFAFAAAAAFRQLPAEHAGDVATGAAVVPLDAS